MYFDPKTPIGPFTLMEARSLVGRLRCSGHVDGWVAQEYLEGVLGRPDTGEVVKVLIAHGFAEASSAGVRSTKLGNRLAASRLSKRLLRSTAERLMAEFMERLHAMNANDEFAYRVDKLVVFGSKQLGLAAKDLVGKINYAVKLAFGSNIQQIKGLTLRDQKRIIETFLIETIGKQISLDNKSLPISETPGSANSKRLRRLIPGLDFCK
ncbi:MAG: hypothetical protein RLO06_14760 [Parvibaculum sp.]